MHEKSLSGGRSNRPGVHRRRRWRVLWPSDKEGVILLELREAYAKAVDARQKMLDLR